VPTVFFYEYDFGDSWMHELRVERIVRANARMRYPRCVAGARLAPPEDCGGPRGYQEWLAARVEDRLFDREQEDDEPVRRFDLDQVNALLREHVHGKPNYGL
jgi:hypothetical protein